jgi:hypothetical protein
MTISSSAGNARLSDLSAVLTLYDKISRGRRPVLDDETDALINHLRLAGPFARKGSLYVRNRIYSQVFDERWGLADARC